VSTALVKTDVIDRERVDDQPGDTTSNTEETVPGTHAEVAHLAYQLWEQRGCPDGCPEEDWFRAEHEIQSQDR